MILLLRAGFRRQLTGTFFEDAAIERVVNGTRLPRKTNIPRPVSIGSIGAAAATTSACRFNCFSHSGGFWPRCTIGSMWFGSESGAINVGWALPSGGNMFRFCRLALICAGPMALSANHAQADVIFSNFGPDYAFSNSSLGFGLVPGETSRAYTAAAFTVPAGRSFRLHDLVLAGTFALPTGVEQSPQPFDVFVLDNFGTGTQPGIVESFTQTVTAPVAPSLFTINSVLRPTLAADRQYWIAVTAGLLDISRDLRRLAPNRHWGDWTGRTGNRPRLIYLRHEPAACF